MSPSMAAVSSLTNDLDKLAPRFDLTASQIHIIDSPASFYATLKAKILGAKKHIFLSTLYIGKDEYELIDTLRQSLQANPGLTVSILTDYLRGNRETPNPSCATLLFSLVKEYPHRVCVSMYHTPNLHGFKKKMLPKRINEGWGLQHMKLYGFDDEILLSGANLSNDYFTNRQDRYHLFSSPDLTRYYQSIFEAVASVSFRMVPDEHVAAGFELLWPSNSVSPSPLDDPLGYTKHATSLLRRLVKPCNVPSPHVNTDTSVYPLSQFTPIMKPDESTELTAMSMILRSLATTGLAKSSWTFTAGYFNMTPDIRALLLASEPRQGTVVAASPWANGFYGSKGVSGLLPAAYTLLSRRFLQSVTNAGLESQITLKEWRRGTVNEADGWTYHAKGLWVTLPDQSNPCMTIIGSSNYTKRSYSLDLETNALVVTRDKGLMERLGREESLLQEYARPVDRSEFEKPERRVGLHVRLAMWIVTLIGGAL